MDATEFSYNFTSTHQIIRLHMSNNSNVTLKVFRTWNPVHLSHYISSILITSLPVHATDTRFIRKHMKHPANKGPRTIVWIPTRRHVPYWPCSCIVATQF